MKYPLVVSALFSFIALAAFSAVAAEDIAAKLEEAESYSFTLSIKSEMKQLSPGTWEEGSFFAHRIVPFVLRKAFSRDGNGDVDIKISLGKDTYELHSTGLPESIFALKHLAPDGAFSKWLERNVPDTTGIAALSGNFHADTVEVEIKDAENILAPAKATYDRNRAALIATFNKAYLYYPPAAEMTWILRETKKDGALFAVAGCSDRMYAANFEVALSKDKNGKWAAGKVFAMEFFKGE
jgi:hypothetical protein